MKERLQNASETELRRKFYSAVHYNGDSSSKTIDGYTTQFKYFYGFRILIMEEQRNQNPT